MHPAKQVLAWLALGDARSLTYAILVSRDHVCRQIILDRLWVDALSDLKPVMRRLGCLGSVTLDGATPAQLYRRLREAGYEWRK